MTETTIEKDEGVAGLVSARPLQKAVFKTTRFILGRGLAFEKGAA